MYTRILRQGSIVGSFTHIVIQCIQRVIFSCCTSGNLYFVDEWNYRIREITNAAVILPTSVITPSSSTFSLFPNPSTGVFTFKGFNTGNNDVGVYNTFGEKVFGATFLKDPAIIDLSAQPPGLYYLYLKSGETINVEKMVINH